MKIGFLITARLKSTRLPKKLMLEVNGAPYIIWMLRRLKLAPILSEIVVLSTQVMGHDVDTYDQIDGPELSYRNRQKVEVTLEAFPAGHVLRSQDIALKMLDSAEGGLLDIASLVGKALNMKVLKGARLTTDTVQ